MTDAERDCKRIMEETAKRLDDTRKMTRIQREDARIYDLTRQAWDRSATGEVRRA